MWEWKQGKLKCHKTWCSYYESLGFLNTHFLNCWEPLVNFQFQKSWFWPLLSVFCLLGFVLFCFVDVIWWEIFKRKNRQGMKKGTGREKYKEGKTGNLHTAWSTWMSPLYAKSYNCFLIPTLLAEFHDLNIFTPC